jgi:hypothetical protein
MDLPEMRARICADLDAMRSMQSCGVKIGAAMPEIDTHPKAGDKVGDRTIINVSEKYIIFGKREGDLENCGAYITDYREWFRYEYEQSK